MKLRAGEMILVSCRRCGSGGLPVAISRDVEIKSVECPCGARLVLPPVIEWRPVEGVRP